MTVGTKRNISQVQDDNTSSEAGTQQSSILKRKPAAAKVVPIKDQSLKSSNNNNSNTPGANITPGGDDVLKDKTMTQPNTQVDSVFSTQLLKLYYEYMFPIDPYADWLSYFKGGTDKHWNHREFSFTTEINGQEIYQRYKSFNDKHTFHNLLKKQVPHKIDIGAIFNKEPKFKHQVSNMEVEEKECVIDIDISDYDDVRTCCQDKAVCDECWPLMNCAVKVLNKLLRQDFGLQHLFFVFSGRRGIHCWVGDDHARKIDTNARSALIAYLSFKHGQEVPYELHNMIKEAYAICVEYFDSCSLRKQDILGTDERILKFIELIRFPDLKKEIRIDLLKNKDMSSEDKWLLVKQHFSKSVKVAIAESNRLKKAKKTVESYEYTNTVKELEYNVMEIVLHYTYPRLDVEVTRHLNHLLKSPFCVHPKTGKLCIPIDADECDNFSPLTGPTLRTLHAELEQALSKERQLSKDSQEKVDWKKIPMMRKYVDIWKKTFLDGLQEDNKADSMEL